MAPTVRLLFFAGAREAAGCPELRLSVPRAGLTTRELLVRVRARYPGMARVLRASRVVRNGEYVAGEGERIVPGDEVAIHPPYSGG